MSVPFSVPLLELFLDATEEGWVGGNGLSPELQGGTQQLSGEGAAGLEAGGRGGSYSLGVPDNTMFPRCVKPLMSTYVCMGHGVGVGGVTLGSCDHSCVVFCFPLPKSPRIPYVRV